MATSVPKKHKKRSFDYKEFACGCGAAFVNITITYPIYKVIFRQMLHGVGITSAFSQLSKEGSYFLYRGILPPLCQKAISLSLMFGVYEEVRGPLERANVPPLIALCTAASIAGCTEAVLMPFERVQTILQDRNYHNQYKNTPHVIRVMGKEHGFREYYRGLVPILLRNVISNTLFFYLRDEAKVRIPTPVSWWGELAKEFLSGAVIGASIGTLIYPFNVVKVQMQRTIGGKFESWIFVLAAMYKERGTTNLYRGVHMNYTRSFLSWGIINASYHFFRKSVFVEDVVVDGNRDE